MAETNNFLAPVDVQEQLQKTAKTYRNKLITMPTRGLKKSLSYMTLRPGIRVSETVGELTGGAEFGPYVTNGDALKNVPITLQVLQLLALKLGKNLDKVLFKAVRNPTGTGSADLFNGFDTIAKTELDAGKLSSDLGNLIKIADILGDNKTINDDNAVDFAQGICEFADEELMSEDKVYLYVPQSFVNLYNRAYLKKFGAVPYNKDYNHLTVEGFSNVEFAVLSNKKDAPFFELTTKSNMLVGVNEVNNNDAEQVKVEKYHPFKLDFIATKFFGTQFESINKERALFITDDGTKPLIQKAAAASVSQTEDEQSGKDTTADGNV